MRIGNKDDLGTKSKELSGVPWCESPNRGIGGCFWKLLGSTVIHDDCIFCDFVAMILIESIEAQAVTSFVGSVLGTDSYHMTSVT